MSDMKKDSSDMTKFVTDFLNSMSQKIKDLHSLISGAFEAKDKNELSKISARIKEL